MKHLRFSYAAAIDYKDVGHAQTAMKDLGITYQHSTPQSMAGMCGEFWFWNCKNIPEELPEYITELKANPKDYVGYGLSEEDVLKIINGGDKK